MNEVWLSIFGFEGLYEVSNMGNIRSLNRVVLFSPNNNSGSTTKNGCVLKYYVNEKGYAKVKLSKGNKGKMCRVHRIVATYFVPNPHELPEVNHKDGNKLNNKFDNLEWATRQSNIDHAYNILGVQTARFGKQNNKSRLVINNETGIFYETITEAANTINMKQATLQAMLTGRNPNRTNFVLSDEIVVNQTMN